MSEQPPIGGFCDACGHFAARHSVDGCHFDRPSPQEDCRCPVMVWQGTSWPRPWLPAPDGLTLPRRQPTPTDSSEETKR